MQAGGQPGQLGWCECDGDVCDRAQVYIFARLLFHMPDLQGTGCDWQLATGNWTGWSAAITKLQTAASTLPGSQSGDGHSLAILFEI